MPVPAARAVGGWPPTASIAVLMSTIPGLTLLAMAGRFSVAFAAACDCGAGLIAPLELESGVPRRWPVTIHPTPTPADRSTRAARTAASAERPLRWRPGAGGA